MIVSFTTLFFPPSKLLFDHLVWNSHISHRKIVAQVPPNTHRFRGKNVVDILLQSRSPKYLNYCKSKSFTFIAKTCNLSKTDDSKSSSYTGIAHPKTSMKITILKLLQKYNIMWTVHKNQGGNSGKISVNYPSNTHQIPDQILIKNSSNTDQILIKYAPNTDQIFIKNYNRNYQILIKYASNSHQYASNTHQILTKYSSIMQQILIKYSSTMPLLLP